MKDLSIRYLERLSDLYPTIAAASTEVINLEAILNLPKGTEHFLTDIHGEYEAFSHVLKNGSGAVRRKVNDVFRNTLSNADKRSLATLIYYPREKMEQVLSLHAPGSESTITPEDPADTPGIPGPMPPIRPQDSMVKTQKDQDREDWYKITLYRLIQVCKSAASKYTRSKVRKALPPEFAYVIEELVMEKEEGIDKESYYNAIIQTIIRVGRAEEFITALCHLIQRLVVDHLHIVGDIYDRGPGPHIIMDKLMGYHSIDIQWGNHDVLWMGAAAGQICCIANVIRICARYGNLDILEDGYGINLLPLATFSLAVYGDDPCTCFQLKGGGTGDPHEREMNIKLHKAISIIQFKAEGQLIKKNPQFKMEKRNLLHLMDLEKGTIRIDGQDYPLLDKHFPTLDPADPYAFTEQEEEIVRRLERAFLNCEKLQQHMKFLLAKGSLHKVYNGNLLYHGCIPLNEDGSLRQVEIYGKRYKGKALYDVLDNYVRKGFVARDEKERQRGRDMMWYIWLHEDSPLFGKDKMATFERYFLADKELQREKKNPYYHMLEQEEVLDEILQEFGLPTETSHIINGHVPVKTKNGESPIKCGGKALVIDGGFSKAYQKETGIAGYTLIYNSYGLILAAHEPFESTEAAIQKESDIHSESIVGERVDRRKLGGDTDIGKELKEKIMDLEQLLEAYRSGTLVERYR